MTDIWDEERIGVEKVMIPRLMLELETEMENMGEEATNLWVKNKVLLGSRRVNGLMIFFSHGLKSSLRWESMVPIG